MSRVLKLSVSLLTGLFAPTAVIWAQSRGGSCTSFLCNLTALAVLLVLGGIFLASVTASIKNRGLVKGSLGNSGVQLLLGYLAMLAVVAGSGLGVLALLGKV